MRSPVKLETSSPSIFLVLWNIELNIRFSIYYKMRKSLKPLKQNFTFEKKNAQSQLGQKSTFHDIDIPK